MFERNKIDNSRDAVRAAADVELNDGRRIKGHFVVARSKNLVEVLNSPVQFIEFERFDGEPENIAKAAIKSLRIISAPRGHAPTVSARDSGTFNPHEILGVEKGASRAEVRAAFHKCSMTYHPDRYSSAELPPEVMRYLEAMARRINAAYEVLAEDASRREAFAAQRTTPIYQSGPAA